jgi:hypothetical protein
MHIGIKLNQDDLEIYKQIQDLARERTGMELPNSEILRRGLRLCLEDLEIEKQIDDIDNKTIEKVLNEHE